MFRCLFVLVAVGRLKVLGMLVNCVLGAAACIWAIAALVAHDFHLLQVKPTSFRMGADGNVFA